MSKAKEWAEKMNGREYLGEIARDEQAQAKADRVLIVYVASDDLTEFDGILHDESGAYGSATHHLRSGKRGWEIGGQDGEDFDIASYPVKIKAEWSPAGVETSWRITSNIPGHAFTIKEDGETYYIGIVIDEQDMFAAQIGP
jgi:hypothetical protein